MATVIDSLVVALGLDATNFKKGQKETQDSLAKTATSATAARKQVEVEAKKQAEAYTTIRDSVLSLTAAVVGALAGGALIKALTTNDAAVGNLARNIGSTVQEVSLLEVAFKRMGSTAQEADGFLRNTNKILQDIKLTGTSSALDPFVRAGLNVGAFRDARSNTERLQMLQNAARKMTPQDAQTRLQEAGYGEETINLILQTRVSLEKLLDTSRKYASTQEDINAAFDRQQGFGTFGVQLETITRQMVTRFTPAMEKFQGIVRDALDYFIEHEDVAVASTIALGAAMTALGATQLSGLIGAVGTLTGGLGMAGGAARLLLGLMGGLASVAAAGAGGFAIGTGINSLISKGLSSVTGKDTDLGSWLYDLTHKDNYGFSTGGKGGGASAGSSADLFKSLESKYGLPSGMLDSMWAQESSRGKNMLSGAGAKGHFGFMDGTAKQYGVNDPNDLSQSASGAAQYMSELHNKYGDWGLALAAYNGGPGNLDKRGFGGMKPETLAYPGSIFARMNAGKSGGGGGGAGISVGDVTINTTASTMSGAGSDLARSIQNHMLADQINSGMN